MDPIQAGLQPFPRVCAGRGRDDGEEPCGTGHARKHKHHSAANKSLQGPIAGNISHLAEQQDAPRADNDHVRKIQRKQVIVEPRARKVAIEADGTKVEAHQAQAEHKQPPAEARCVGAPLGSVGMLCGFLVSLLLILVQHVLVQHAVHLQDEGDRERVHDHLHGVLAVREERRRLDGKDARQVDRLQEPHKAHEAPHGHTTLPPRIHHAQHVLRVLLDHQSDQD
mmetsp:Transcript_9253/g.25947  ORF Transcript_9253/g.25947 Transcript_9253/m.25947 type:complete len:224 (+) Transcript_9253:2-673(+)